MAVVAGEVAARGAIDLKRADRLTREGDAAVPTKRAIEAGQIHRSPKHTQTRSRPQRGSLSTPTAQGSLGLPACPALVCVVLACGDR